MHGNKCSTPKTHRHRTTRSTLNSDTSVVSAQMSNPFIKCQITRRSTSYLHRLFIKKHQDFVFVFIFCWCVWSVEVGSSFVFVELGVANEWRTEKKQTLGTWTTRMGRSLFFFFRMSVFCASQNGSSLPTQPYRTASCSNNFLIGIEMWKKWFYFNLFFLSFLFFQLKLLYEMFIFVH